ncbi:hypothetical protein J3Q64DRAFT_1720719 [Phycomyces blakesleeanus]|uniref:Mediator of RNA polymerase II transcription subunit 19 n=1 Tax=Phycomyces blakesleeanus TaxID=4837 RepID=A0ABR3B9K7_PHYBL
MVLFSFLFLLLLSVLRFFFKQKKTNDLVGKYDVEPDGYLINLLRDPQAVESGPKIKRLDPETLEDAFSLKEGPVPGFDASILGTDDGGSSTYSGVNPGQYLHTERGEYGASAGDEMNKRERKKKKKKRKHSHDHDEDGHTHEHKKKKKRKKEKEERGYRRDEEGETLVID